MAGVVSAAIAAISTPLSAPLHAEELRDALASAYASNPTLLAARDQLRATDAGVPLARADGLPSLSASVQEMENVQQSRLSSGSTYMPRVFSMSGALSVPVFSGGAVRNAVHAAETRVVAGRADLRAVESGVFSQTVTAYLDVIRTEAIVRLNMAQVQTLEVNLKATSDRFQIGELTRTDVAQSQSRLALAQGNLRSAEAAHAVARETYIQVVGKPAGQLASPPALTAVPANVEDAVAYALDHNPDLLAAHERARAAGFDRAAAGAARLPKISIFADTARTDYQNSLRITGVPAALTPQSTTTADVGIRATIPLYQGGRPSALVRQAEARESQSLDQLIGVERQVIAGVRSAWSNYRAAQAIITSTQKAVDAAQLSLKGVRAENSVGNRTILDILNAEQELINAQVQLVTAQRNAYVAGFSLLSAMGRAEARDLGLDTGSLYDPEAHYRRAAGDYLDWGSDGRPQATATRTVDTPPQSGTIPAK
ncbi:TolC family outer membrane protein [Novosphingobium sp. FSY-8]|uniref:TolC family outer membrane protein n=1 Tax=Novosphingobium ovatum TaxID=1908523 RepID=A0ABW9XHI1_9SPHN|nr:TolC family outer membrane protein [Novosphingobium ovatum]NBC37993.1 TolC family outer membrane protein [Novosphingobium ovatum]